MWSQNGQEIRSATTLKPLIGEVNMIDHLVIMAPEDAIPGCWPSRQSSQEKAISEPGPQKKKMDKRTLTVNRGRLVEM